MRALLLIAANDLRLFLRNPGSWVSLVLLPVLFTLVLGFAFAGGDSPQRLRLDVIDQDHSPASARLLAAFAQTEQTLLVCLSTTESPEGCDLPADGLTVAAGLERVQGGESAALLVIPAGLATALTEFSPAQLEYYSAIVPPAPDPVRQIVATILPRLSQAALNRQVASAVLTRLAQTQSVVAPAGIELAAASVYSATERMFAQRPAAVEYLSVGTEPAATATQGFGQSVPGMGSMYVMFTVLGGIVSLQRDRQRWTLPRLAAMPLRRGQILGGKILTYFVLGMVQYLVVFAVGWLVGLDFGPRPWLLWPVMAAFVLCCTALALALAPLMSNPGQAGLLAQLLSLSFAALGGAWWPLEIVAPWMRMVGHLSPVAWAMDGFRDLLFYQGDLAAILPEVGVLLAAAALCFGFGIWRFRYL